MKNPFNKQCLEALLQKVKSNISGLKSEMIMSEGKAFFQLNKAIEEAQETEKDILANLKYSV